MRCPPRRPRTVSAEWCGRLSRNPRHVVHGCGVVARRKLYTRDLVQDARAQLRVGKSAPDTDALLGTDFDYYISVCVAKGPRGFFQIAGDERGRSWRSMTYHLNQARSSNTKADTRMPNVKMCVRNNRLCWRVLRCIEQGSEIVWSYA